MYFCYTVVVVEFFGKFFSIFASTFSLVQSTRLFYQGTEFENIQDTCEEGFTKQLGAPIPKRDFIYV